MRAGGLRASGLTRSSRRTKRDVDRTLIRENLRLTVEQRFDALVRLQQFAEELRRAGRAAPDADEAR